MVVFLSFQGKESEEEDEVAVSVEHRFMDEFFEQVSITAADPNFCVTQNSAIVA